MNFSLSASLYHNVEYLPWSLDADRAKTRAREMVAYCSERDWTKIKTLS